MPLGLPGSVCVRGGVRCGIGQKSCSHACIRRREKTAHAFALRGSLATHKENTIIYVISVIFGRNIGGSGGAYHIYICVIYTCRSHIYVYT